MKIHKKSKLLFIIILIVSLLAIVANYGRIEIEYNGLAYNVTKDTEYLSAISNRILDTNLYIYKKKYYKILFTYSHDETTKIIAKKMAINDEISDTYDFMLCDYVFSFLQTNDLTSFNEVFLDKYDDYNNMLNLEIYINVLANQSYLNEQKMNLLVTLLQEKFKDFSQEEVNAKAANLIMQSNLYYHLGNQSEYDKLQKEARSLFENS